jgi:hypothetical protein
MGAACRKEAGAVVGAETAPLVSNEFAPFSQINDDLILYILSFVSYAPFENDTSSTMTLADLSRCQFKEREEQQVRRILEDYNAGSTELKRSEHKKQASLAPFRAPKHYYQAAFHSSASFSGQFRARVSSTKSFGTLTHVLPLVCKQFHVLCNESNVLWTESLERLLGFKNSRSRCDIGSSDLWEKGLLSFIQSSGGAIGDETTSNDRSKGPSDESVHPEYERARKLISKAEHCFNRQNQSANTTDGSVKDYVAQETADALLEDGVSQEVFRQVLLYHKPVRLPVFTLSAPAAVGEELYFRLHEPRYRLLIADVMAGRSASERNGYPVATPRPRFLFACKPNSLVRKVACLLEVRRCHIHRDGIADVVIVPISWVVMQDVVTRPQSGGLLDATVVQSPTRLCMPVFCSMLTRLRLGRSVRLLLIERRYKTLIADVMAGRPQSERNGSFLAMPRPQFIYVCQSPLKPGIVACIVEVERCLIQSDGTARLTAVPCSWVVIESLTSRPNSGWLFDANVLCPTA